MPEPPISVTGARRSGAGEPGWPSPYWGRLHTGGAWLLAVVGALVGDIAVSSTVTMRGEHQKRFVGKTPQRR